MVQNAASLMYGFVFVCLLLLIPCSSMLNMLAWCHVQGRVVFFISAKDYLQSQIAHA